MVTRKLRLSSRWLRYKWSPFLTQAAAPSSSYFLSSGARSISRRMGSIVGLCPREGSAKPRRVGCRVRNFVLARSDFKYESFSWQYWMNLLWYFQFTILWERGPVNPSNGFPPRISCHILSGGQPCRTISGRKKGIYKFVGPISAGSTINIVKFRKYDTG